MRPGADIGYAGAGFGERFSTGAQVQRWIIDPATGAHSMQVLFEGECELPTIDYQRYNMRPYQYVYGVGTSQRCLVKLSLKDRETKRWPRSYVGVDVMVGEPIFVHRPGGHEEDDGVVLSIVFDLDERRSFLLVLDAIEFVEVARAMIPGHIPAQLHGMFVSESQPAVSSKL